MKKRVFSAPLSREDMDPEYRITYENQWLRDTRWPRRVFAAVLFTLAAADAMRLTLRELLGFEKST